ncbi:MAG TPA: hypothetical protein VFT65_05510, partial [Candidatus Angelobacter sp.]|nr:hypothetical protein [Candidatus Angelobacter sp.]
MGLKEVVISRFTTPVFPIASLISRKKLSFAIAVAASIVAIAGCGGVKSGSTAGPTPTPGTPGATPTPTPTASSVNVPTWHMNNGRTGLNDEETSLSPANVNTAGFGKLFSYSLDGYTYASPLYMSNLRINGASHNVVFAATEMASIYAFDADTFGDGSPLWKTSLLVPGGIPQPGGNPKPSQGLTSTPVIDPATSTMYAVTAQDVGGAFSFRLHALDITTG